MTPAIMIAAFGALTISLLCTPVVRSIALNWKVGDYPGERKVHTAFTPRLGGAAIILAFLVGFSSSFLIQPGAVGVADTQRLAVALAFALVILLGVYDDFKGIGSLGKMSVQLSASLLIVFSGLQLKSLALPMLDPIPLGVFAVPVTLLWLVGVTNAVNLLDGLDGLAAGVAAIASMSLAFIGWQFKDPLIIIFCVSLCFACLGFLRYNFNPASIFMGDTGSLFLGFALAYVALRILNESHAEAPAGSLMVAVAVLFVPIVDTSVAFFRRLRKGMHPLKPDKEHIHHRLMELGLTHRQTVIIIYAISAFNGLVAVLLTQLNGFYGSILIIIVFLAMYFSIQRLGYIEEMKTKRGAGAMVIRPLSVARMIERALLVFGDVVAIVIAFLFSYWFRFGWGVVSEAPYLPLESYLINPVVLLLTLFYLMLFWLGGLYDVPWDLSRIDYSLTILKWGGVGTLVLFVFTLDLSAPTIRGRVTTLVFGASVVFFVTLVRMFIVSAERRHEVLGFRRRNTLVVGTTSMARDLLREIDSRPGLKYNVVGFVDRDPGQHEFAGYPILGNHESIPEVVNTKGIEEVLVATSYDAREEILDIVARCEGIVPSVKVVPISQASLSGLRTEEIIGHPLVRVYPTNLKTWQRFAKRLIDVVVALLLLVPFLPFWVLISILIKADSHGPVFLVQERVGKKGRPFRLFKFRSMIFDAERDTGPIWAAPDDKRATRVGRFLRRFRFDEVPQLLNVLKGEMSLVGPRPERPYFVDQLKQEVRFYTRRLLVRPGITGWAQVRHRYDVSIQDVKDKLRYDLYYLENMSLTLDLKIILRTIIVAVTGKETH